MICSDPQQLLRENEQLRQRLEEAEETLRALRSGEVDAVVVDREQERVYTLETPDKPYRLLVHRPQAAATVTTEGTIISCNRRFADLLGRPRSGLNGRLILEFVAPESRAPLEALLADPPAADVDVDLTLERPEGTSVDVHLGFAWIQEGAFGECILITDHTEQRHYEELRATQETLRAVSERLELAQEAGGIGTFEWDLRTGELVWSTIEQELYGLAPDEFGGRYQDWAQRLHPDDREYAEAAVARALAERTGFDTEFRIVRPNGEVRWLTASGKVHCDEDGEPIHVIGVNFDITERKRVVHELEEAGTKKDEFLATLAHELRNPLAPISNAIELLEQGGGSEADVRWCSGVIHRQVQVMARLLEDLLDISRIARVRLELRKQRLELASVLEAALDTSRPLIEAGGHRLEIDLPPGPIHLYADPIRLAQVFANLLNNAAKYTPPGGNIRVSAQRRGTDVIVEVEDDGIGITPEMLPEVFEIFSQARPASLASQDGLGIGLSLVKGLVELHGGSVEAESEGPGRGSVFRVCLPGLPESTLDEPSPDGDAGAASLPIQRRILVADDNYDSADSLARLLSSAGNEVRTAYDGQQCLEVAAEFHPDVILLDIGMPRMDGYEVCRRIRREDWGQGILMIAVTGWGQEQDRRRTVAAGFDVHLVKPVRPARLFELLAEQSGSYSAPSTTVQ
jgi:PAS domain S-box-containing protein